jgi:hypothetical protein
LFDENNILFFSSFFFFFFSFFFAFLFHLHFLSLFLFLLEKIRAQLVLRANTTRDVDALLSFDEEAKINRDVEAKAFEKTSRDIINIFINVSFRRSLKNVDL